MKYLWCSHIMIESDHKRSLTVPDLNRFLPSMVKFPAELNENPELLFFAGAESNYEAIFDNRGYDFMFNFQNKSGLILISTLEKDSDS